MPDIAHGSEAITSELFTNKGLGIRYYFFHEKRKQLRRFSPALSWDCISNQSYLYKNGSTRISVRTFNLSRTCSAKSD